MEGKPCSGRLGAVVGGYNLVADDGIRVGNRREEIALGVLHVGSGLFQGRTVGGGDALEIGQGVRYAVRSGQSFGYVGQRGQLGVDGRGSAVT